MNVYQFKIQDNHELLSWITDLPKQNIILGDYFYYTPDSFITNTNIYADIKVCRILNLTDQEYAELINKYLSNSDSSAVQEDPNAFLKQKYDKLNQRIHRSKEYEEARKKVTKIEDELHKHEKDLLSYDGLEDKINDAQKQVITYSNFSRFNLLKVHEDLVNLNTQIEKLEEDLIGKKIVEIKDSKIQYEFDSGKIGLALGIVVGMAIFGAIFLSLNTPIWIPSLIWGIGIFAAILIIFFSKVPKESLNNIESTNYSPSEIANILENLKVQRNSILNLVGARNSNEFFLIKAKYSSARKNLDYMSNLKKELSTNLDTESLKLQRDKLIAELEVLKPEIQDPSVLLKQEEYLSLYREVDSLKLQLGNTPNTNIVKNDIPKKLSEIRIELMEKLPTYASVLKNTFLRSFENISHKVSDFGNTVGRTIAIDVSLSSWSVLNKFDLFIIELSMAQEVYIENFAFILDEISSWNQEEFDLLKSFLDNNKDAKFDIYILDYDRIF